MSIIALYNVQLIGTRLSISQTHSLMQISPNTIVVGRFHQPVKVLGTPEHRYPHPALLGLAVVKFDSTQSGPNRTTCREMLKCSKSLETTHTYHTFTNMSATGAQLGSTCGFSTRLSLRWVPEVPEETTDTIVLSVGKYFVDLRMDKKSGEIDWAMAGTRIEENPGQIPRSYPRD